MANRMDSSGSNNIKVGRTTSTGPSTSSTCSAAASFSGAAGKGPSVPYENEVPPLLSDDSHSASEDESDHDDDEEDDISGLHSGDGDEDGDAEYEDEYMPYLSHERNVVVSKALHKVFVAAQAIATGGLEPLVAELQEVWDDEDDDDGDDIPGLLSSSDEHDRQSSPRHKPPALAVPQREAVQAPVANAPLNLRKGFFDAPKISAAKRTESANVKSTAFLPQSSETPATRRSTPYSNAGVGIRESIRPELPQSSRPTNFGWSHQQSQEHSHQSSTTMSWVQPSTGKQEAMPTDHNDIPELLDSDTDEIGIPSLNDSHRTWDYIYPHSEVQSLNVGAVAGQPGQPVAGRSEPKASPGPSAPMAPKPQRVMQERPAKRSKESRKNREAPSSSSAMSRADFANDDAWQRHLARELEERKRLRRELGLVASSEQGAGADAVLGHCCLRPGNDTACICDEPGYTVKETQRRYHLQCTKGCFLMFHDKCWRPFLDGMAQLKGDDFDRNFKANTKEGKVKLHECVTDCCDGYVCRVYISQAPEAPGAKQVHELYVMDPVLRLAAAAAGAARRRKRFPGEAWSQGLSTSDYQAAKKSCKMASGKSAVATAASTVSTAARAARREERRRAAAEVATAAAAAGEQDNGQEGQAHVEMAQRLASSRPMASKGISIVVRAKNIQTGDLDGGLDRYVDDEAIGIRLDRDWAVAAPPALEPDAGGAMQQPADAAVAWNFADDDNMDVVVAVPPAPTSTAVGGAKKKRKGYKMHLEEFMAGGCSSTVTVASGSSGGAVSAPTAAMMSPQVNDEAMTYNMVVVEGNYAPQPPEHPEARYSGFPTLNAAMEQQVRRSGVPVEDYVMEALSKLRLDERQGGSTNILLLERLDLRYMDRQPYGAESYLITELEKYGSVIRLHVFREQECAAVEMETDDVAYNVFVIFRNQTIGSMRPRVCFLQEFPTMEVLNRYIETPSDSVGTTQLLPPCPKVAAEDTWEPMTTAAAAAACVMSYTPALMPPSLPSSVAASTAQLGTAAGILGNTFSGQAAPVGGPLVTSEFVLQTGGFLPYPPHPEGASPSMRSNVTASSKPLATPQPRKKVLPIIDANTREIVNKEAVRSLGSIGTTGTDPITSMAAAVGGTAAWSTAVTHDLSETSGGDCGGALSRVRGVRIWQQSTVAATDSQKVVKTAGKVDVGPTAAAGMPVWGASESPIGQAASHQGPGLANSSLRAEAIVRPTTAAQAPSSTEKTAAESGSPIPLQPRGPGAVAPVVGAPQQHVSADEECGTLQRLGEKGGDEPATTATAVGSGAGTIDGMAASADIGGNRSMGMAVNAENTLGVRQTPSGSCAVLVSDKSIVKQEAEEGVATPSRNEAAPTDGVRAGAMARNASVDSTQLEFPQSVGAATVVDAEAAAAPSRNREVAPPQGKMALAAPTERETVPERPFTTPMTTMKEVAFGDDLSAVMASTQAASTSAEASEMLHSESAVASVIAAAPAASTDHVATAGAAPGPAPGAVRGSLQEALMQRAIPTGTQVALPLVSGANRGGVPAALVPPVTTAITAASVAANAAAAANAKPPTVKPSILPNSSGLDNFWQGYDVVYILNCETKYLSTYLQHDFKLDIMFFVDWDATVPTSRVALLLFNRDTEEVLGLWAALHNDDKYVVLRLVRRLPAISKGQFLATPVGARVFPGLPYLRITKAHRAVGQDSRDVLRVLAMHELATVAGITGLLRAPMPIEGVPVVSVAPASGTRTGVVSAALTTPHVMAAPVAATVGAAKATSFSNTPSALQGQQQGGAPHPPPVTQNILDPLMPLAPAPIAGVNAAESGSETADAASPLATTVLSTLESAAAPPGAPITTALNDTGTPIGAAPSLPQAPVPPLPPSFRPALMMLLEMHAAARAPAAAAAPAGVGAKNEPPVASVVAGFAPPAAASPAAINPLGPSSVASLPAPPVATAPVAAPPASAPPVAVSHFAASPLAESPAVESHFTTAPMAANPTAATHATALHQAVPPAARPPTAALPAPELTPSGAVPAVATNPTPVFPVAAVRPALVPPAMALPLGARPVAAGVAVRPPGVPVVTGLPTVLPNAPTVRPVVALMTQGHARPPHPIAAGMQPLMRPSLPLHAGQAPVRVLPIGGMARPRPVVTGMASLAAGAMPAPGHIRPQAPGIVGAQTAAVQPFSTVPGSALATAAPVAPAQQQAASPPPPSGHPARPRQPVNSLMCAICHQRTGGFVLLGCKHMAPCIECCSEPSMYGQLYPVCWCGAHTEDQPTHKVHLS